MQKVRNGNLFLAVFYSGLLSFSALVSANTCDEGIGGTGVTADGYGGTGVTNEGYGGTGITAEGYGGTGISAQNEGFGGTGIVGVITGFASVCVNGVEAHFDSNTKVDIDGTSSSIDKLNIGEFVAIDAKGQGAEVSAQHISVIHALVGRVEAVYPAKNQVKIMGQTVQLSTVTLGATKVKVGQNIAVSGFSSANGMVQAMRTDIVADTTPASVAGKLINGKISGVAVTGIGKTQAGVTLQAIGNWDGKALAAVDVKQNALDRVMRMGYAFSAQGLVYRGGDKQALYALGKQIYIDANTKVYGDKNTPNAVMVVRGQIDKYGRAVAKDVDYRSIESALERGGSKERPISVREEKKLRQDATNETQRNKNADKAEHKKPEKPNANEKPERVETPDKIDKVEQIERPEKVEKVEKLEKVEVPERAEAPEKPEKYTY